MLQIILHFIFPVEKTYIEKDRKIQEPVYNNAPFTVRVHEFELTGSAPPNSIIGIKKDDVFVSTKIVKNDSFRISDLSLNQGDNRLSVWVFLADGRRFFLDSINLVYHSASLELLARPVYRVATRQGMLALTYDCGSSAKGADSIIAILRDKNISCTFFLTGGFINRFPDVVMELYRDGHEMANHTFSHPHLTTWAQNSQHQTLNRINRGLVQDELLKTDSLYRKLTGLGLHGWWRAPFGEFNQQILQWAAEIGYRHVGWTPGCDTFDWVTDTTSQIYRSPQEMLDHFLTLEAEDQLHGAIILMHLNSERMDDHAYQILPQLIDTLHQMNYSFVTISELLNKGCIP